MIMIDDMKWILNDYKVYIIVNKLYQNYYPCCLSK